MIDTFDPSPMYQSSFAGEPDWQRDEDALFDASIRVLKQFATDAVVETLSDTTVTF